ncbi:outer membrane protein (porin) [Ectothiorhodospira sp. PHS-1]|uniref:porin n=1 Tax=Ectothiorhodospira sp. PHS-1 TaxID=519989 RepID=UPI00024A82D7|nr:porin [Ectothiorhodospira sp. PHS-1]EHQ51579.1 outer membrane protein (porin) [Ectothiorhodospira sp. PHS-1]
MQKKVLVFAVAAAMGLPAAAMADTTLYGRLNVSMDRVNDGDASSHQIASNASRIGVRGSEDLGAGLRGVFQMEAGFDAANGGGELATRNTYLGVASEFGEVRLGRHDTPYKISTLRLDPFADTLGDYNSIMGSFNGAPTAFENRHRNTAIYLSPNFDGLQFMASYTTDTRANGDTRFGNTGVIGLDPAGNPVTGVLADEANEQNAFSLAGTFTQGPMYVAVAYEQLNDWAGTGDDGKAWKVGGAYTIDALTLSAMYENIDSGITGLGDRDAFFLSAKYQFGQAYVMGTYANAGDDDRDDSGAQLFAIGAGYDLTRRTGLYATYATVRNDDNAVYELGGNATGKSKGVVPAAAGENAWGFQVGVTHNF